MHYASLASGSKGNCHALSHEGRTLLIDVGISFLQIRMRLQALNWRLDQVRGIAITHEHSDHIRAIPMILKRTDWAILATPGTIGVAESGGIKIPEGRMVPLRAGNSTNWDGWTIKPFSVSHDAIDPIAYRIEVPDCNLAVITDLGYVSALVVDYCKGLDILVIESNHDIEMLREGPYDPWLKARIFGRTGHLSNDACAELLKKAVSPKLKHIVLAHLSEQNNEPVLARLASQSALSQNGSDASLHVATQKTPLEICLA
ncbi:MAG: MBL fold metallo-hydrolase [Holophagaceae bacterium]|nr:MBL fold metallo-hydrolase [Holophagaceae bacterium]